MVSLESTLSRFVPAIEAEIRRIVQVPAPQLGA
jgi:hypothetical protein